MVGEFFIITYILPSTTDLMIFNIGGIVMILSFFPNTTDLTIFNIGDLL